MKTKIVALSLVAFLVFASALQVLPKVYAIHSPDVYWTANAETKSDHLDVSGINWPSWFCDFTVESLPIPEVTPDNIIRIKFVIPRNLTTNLVLFHFHASDQQQGWTATPDEFDAAGWPGVIIFEARTPSPGIVAGGSAQFKIEFSDGPSVCNYDFAVYTVDSVEQTNLNWLHLTIDNKRPDISTLVPTNKDDKNDPVIAIWDPYPIKHYFTIQVAARDTGDHDTGIVWIEIYIDGVFVRKFLPNEYPEQFPEVPITFRYYGLSEGRHTITAVASDGAGNQGRLTNVFWYHIPRLFVLSPSEGSVDSMTTYNPVTQIYTGSINTFGGETFGTLVKATGLAPAPPLSKGFTPNSYVDIWIVHPIFGNAFVNKTVRTGPNGEFEATFLFLTGPYGMYKVMARDRGGVEDEAVFTVIPKIAYNPPIIVGPALIEAMATGLAGNAKITRFMTDNTDALSDVNYHAMDEWYSYNNGTLYTNIAYKPGFLMPVLQNGQYDITLEVQGSYWNGFAGEVGAWERIVHEVHDTVEVANDFKTLLDAMKRVEDSVNLITPIITNINDTVVRIETKVGTIIATLDDLKPRIVEIQTNVKDLPAKLVTIQTTLSTINGTVNTINGATGRIEGNVGTILGTVGRIEAGCVQVNTTVGNIWIKIKDVDFSKLDKLSNANFTRLDDIPVLAREASVKSVQDSVNTSALTIPIGAVLSAVAAIAAIIAAIVVVRRLKVAS